MSENEIVDGSTPPPPTPAVPTGCATLTRIERQALIAASARALLEVRAQVTIRLQSGDPAALVEAALAPIVERALGPLLHVLTSINAEQGLPAAAAVASALLHVALEGDLQAFAILQRAHRPGPDSATS